jgi:UDP-N-acetylmuramyl pentapeptide synthase
MNPDKNHSTTLESLFDQFPLKVLAGKPGDTLVTGVKIDSRHVQPGNLFVAMKGSSADGHDFIPDAIQQLIGSIHSG